MAYYNFQKIKELLDKNGDTTDEIIIKMKFETNEILYKLDKIQNDIFPYEFVKKIKDYYSIKEKIIFTNYMSEVEEEKRKININSEFLSSIESKFLQLNFNYTSHK